jgi:hypothetical protein
LFLFKVLVEYLDVFFGHIVPAVEEELDDVAYGWYNAATIPWQQTI